MTPFTRFLAVVVVVICAFAASILTARFIQAQTETPDVPGIDLALYSNQATAMPGDIIHVDVVAFPNGNTLTAAELRIGFDPQSLTPTSIHPFEPGPFHPLILPNCDFQIDSPCPATSSATLNQALIYLGVNCTNDGCTFPPTDEPFVLASISFTVISPSSFTVTDLSPASPTHTSGPTLTAALNHDTDATRHRLTTGISLTQCALNFDLLPNGSVDIADVMLVANRWGQTIDDPSFNPQFDFTRSYSITIGDIQQVANQWGNSCNN